MPLDVTPSAPAGTRQLSAWMLWLLAVACGMLIANVYFGQPLTGLISDALGMRKESAGLIVTLPLIGYGVGLLAFVPLGDLLENRLLILVLVGVEALSLFLISTVTRPMTFLATAFVLGLAASAVQVVLPYASHLTPERERGQALGRLVSGIMLGIMLARPLSSFVAGYGSWRLIYLLSGGATVLLFAVLRAAAPKRLPVAGPGYGELLTSMVRLLARSKVLRRRALYHAAMFGAFSVFWTAAPLWLAEAPFNLTQNGIAWVALAGVAGAIAPPLAGRLADRGSARPATAGAMVLAAFAFLLSDLAGCGGGLGLAIVVAAAFVLDSAVAANLVFGQRATYALGPEQRGRLNGLFMAIFFSGGAICSALSGWCFVHFGWTGVSALGTALPVAALLYWTTEPRDGRTQG